jgi:hypothetical protein
LAVFTFQASPIPASSFFGRLRVGFPWVIGRSDMLHGMFDICTIHPNNDPFNGPLWFIQSSPFFSTMRLTIHYDHPLVLMLIYVTSNSHSKNNSNVSI